MSSRYKLHSQVEVSITSANMQINQPSLALHADGVMLLNQWNMKWLSTQDKVFLIKLIANDTVKMLMGSKRGIMAPIYLCAVN